MHLSHLEAINFRNLSGALDFAPGLNVIFGANAQGKTNWLEAVYLLGTTKSFKTAQPKEAINHHAEEAILRGTVQQGHLSRDIQLLITKAAKQTFVNGKREAVTRYLGILDAIAFTADEMEVVRGGPEYRRRFVDRGLVSTLPSYLGTLAEYNRVLKQKNSLLRSASETDDSTRFYPLLEPWNDQLIALGTEIHAARLGYVEKLRAALQPKLFQHESITIRYKSSLEGKGDLNDYPKLMRERLAHHLANEIALGYALVGPHRDDVEILCDGYDISRFGSSGQQRSALLILDLAQMVVYHSVLEDYPVFIVDDIDAELDRNRIEILLDTLNGNSQVFISTSKRALAQHYRNRANTIEIANGKLTAEGVTSAA
jgi:DNA replication and repair protein RecF